MRAYKVVCGVLVVLAVSVVGIVTANRNQQLESNLENETTVAEETSNLQDVGDSTENAGEDILEETAESEETESQIVSGKPGDDISLYVPPEADFLPNIFEDKYNFAEGNPTDYSDMEPGTEFYDDYWGGTVIIVGNTGDTEWNDLIKNSEGYMIAIQDGKDIYVKREETDPVEEYITPDPYEDIELPPEQEAYYSQPRIDVDYPNSIVSVVHLPDYAIIGLQYAIKQYMSDVVGGEDPAFESDYFDKVEYLEVIDATVSRDGPYIWFDCCSPTMVGCIHVGLDTEKYAWWFNHSESGESGRYYSAYDFAPPEYREELER